jgi:hypothetical protein
MRRLLLAAIAAASLLLPSHASAVGGVGPLVAPGTAYATVIPTQPPGTPTMWLPPASIAAWTPGPGGRFKWYPTSPGTWTGSDLVAFGGYTNTSTLNKSTLNGLPALWFPTVDVVNSIWLQPDSGWTATWSSYLVSATDFTIGGVWRYDGTGTTQIEAEIVGDHGYIGMWVSVAGSSPPASTQVRVCELVYVTGGTQPTLCATGPTGSASLPHFSILTLSGGNVSIQLDNQTPVSASNNGNFAPGGSYGPYVSYAGNTQMLGLIEEIVTYNTAVSLSTYLTGRRGGVY